MISYSVYLQSTVVESLTKLKAKDCNQLTRLFLRLRTDPFIEGDYVERDEIGRLLQVLVIGRHAVVFWADHAVKEVKIIDLKPAGN